MVIAVVSCEQLSILMRSLYQWYESYDHYGIYDEEQVLQYIIHDGESINMMSLNTYHLKVEPRITHRSNCGSSYWVILYRDL